MTAPSVGANIGFSETQTQSHVSIILVVWEFILFESISISDIVGSIGVAMLLGAFALNLLGHMKREGVAYALLNVVGAGLAAFASWLINYWPFIILEGTWCVVSLFALQRALFGSNPR